MSRDFQSGICDCGHDPANCLFTCFCPCISTAMNRAEADGREWTVFDLFCGLFTQLRSNEYFIRQKIRSDYGFEPDNELCDCLAVWLCPLCVTCQHHRELQFRKQGFVDPHLPPSHRPHGPPGPLGAHVPVMVMQPPPFEYAVAPPSKDIEMQPLTEGAPMYPKPM